MASPTYSPAVYAPVAKPRSLVGNHLLTSALLAGKGRCLGHAQGEPQPEQGTESLGEADAPGDYRPEDQGDPEGNPRPDPVEDPSAGDLQGRVGPRERGEDYPQLRCADVQVLFNIWRDDRQVRAVHVVDRGGDNYDPQNAVADASADSPRGPLNIFNFCCRGHLDPNFGHRLLRQMTATGNVAPGKKSATVLSAERTSGSPGHGTTGARFRPGPPRGR